MSRYSLRQMVYVPAIFCLMVLSGSMGDRAVAAITSPAPSSATCVQCDQPVSLFGFEEFDLVSDLPGAKTLDPNLVNPWGMVFTPLGNIWTSDNGTGLSTNYTNEGAILPYKITIPAPGGGTGAPTGMVMNRANNFLMAPKKPATFLWATEDGTIVGWSYDVNRTRGIILSDQSASGAIYKGIALADNERNTYIYATDFHNGKVDVFNNRFKKVFSFTDKQLVCQGFAPFGIHNFSGNLYVTFAKQDAAKHDDVAGPGNGFVDIFNSKGQLVRRLISHGPLNSPWGMEIFPAISERPFPVLAVGNFGDGRINTFALPKATFLGPIRDSAGSPVVIDGLWEIRSMCVRAMDTTGFEGELRLYFTAGINDEADGLMGYLYQPED